MNFSHTQLAKEFKCGFVEQYSANREKTCPKIFMEHLKIKFSQSKLTISQKVHFC
jgi:hypothetical protein